MWTFIICFAIAFIVFRKFVGGVLGAGKAFGDMVSKAPGAIEEPRESPVAAAPIEQGVPAVVEPEKTIPWTVPIKINDRVRERLYKASVDAGNKIDDACVMKSRQKFLPILAETEAEYTALTDSEHKAVEGDVDAICSLILSYELGLPGFNKSTVKAEHLRRLVLDAASEGNRAAQAASMQPRIFGDDLAKANRSMYEQSISDAVTAGDPDAQFAAGMFLEKYDSYDSLALLYDAATQGNSDAAFYLNKRIESAYYSKGLPFPEYGETFEFVRMGAEADNGVYASNLQEYVAEAYMDGECGLAADKEQARKWFEMARSNGGSAIGLDTLEQTFAPNPASPIHYLTIEDVKSALDA